MAERIVRFIIVDAQCVKSNDGAEQKGYDRNKPVEVWLARWI